MSEKRFKSEKNYVDDKEIVYRLISSPLGYNDITGVSPDCFKLFRKNESYVSVERAKFCNVEEALLKGENIKMWFADGETFWGLASLLVRNIRKHELLDVISKYTKDHPGHAGVLMKLYDGVPYVAKFGEPTPEIILSLQTYLSGIVDKIVKNP